MPTPAPPLNPRRTLAVICGASAWPELTQYLPDQAFAATAQRLHRYLATDAGMGLAEDRLLDLFDDTEPAWDQLKRIGEFLTAGFRRMGAEHGVNVTVLFTYIGHGTFAPGSGEYCLLLHATRAHPLEITSLRVRDLADTFDIGPRSTRLVLLDSCFAGAALPHFQSDVQQVELVKVDEAFGQGVAILCAGSKYDPAIVAGKYTAFGEALLETLERGDADVSGPLSLERVCQLMRQRLKNIKDAPRPEAHDPNQSGVKVSARPLFPNPASSVVADRYAQAINHLNQQEWQQAADLFADIEQEQPGYRDVAALRELAEQNLSPQGRGGNSSKERTTVRRAVRKRPAPDEFGQQATQLASPELARSRRFAPTVARFRQLSRRTKIALIAGAGALVVVIAAAVGIPAIIGHHSSPSSPASKSSQAARPSYGSQVVLPFRLRSFPFDLSSGINGVAVDTTGTTYVSDSHNNCALKLTAGASAAVVLPFTGLTGPEGVAVDSTGSAYVAEDKRVLKLPAGSSPQVVLPFDGLHFPAGLAVDTAGAVYVTEYFNNQVLKLPVGGAQVVLPFTGLYQPQGVAVDTAGSVYVADGGNNRVLKLAPGAATATALQFSGLTGPRGVAVDTAGAVYVADNGNYRVLKLPAGAATQTVLPFTGLSWPDGVAVDGVGNVYVVDSNNSRVLKLPVG